MVSKGECGEIDAFQRNFPHFYTNQALKVCRSPLHAIVHWNVEGKTRKKRKNTVSFMASLGAGAQPRSTALHFMAVEKRPSSQFFLGLEFLSARKSISWPATVKPISNKKQEFEQRKRIKLLDNFWALECVRTYMYSNLAQDTGLEHGRCKQSTSLFQFSAFCSIGLACIVLIFAPIFLRFLLLSSSMQRQRHIVSDYFNFAHPAEVQSSNTLLTFKNRLRARLFL